MVGKGKDETEVQLIPGGPISFALGAECCGYGIADHNWVPLLTV
jgi:hypothetical protein